MRRKKGEEQEVRDTPGERITPADIQQVEFRLSFRGYNERDVDAFLDRLTEDLSSYLDDLEGLRAGAPTPSVAAPGADLGVARQQADAIVARARDEAGAIVRAAEQQAAALRASAGAAGGDSRAAVAPFLNTEREFLQSLGTLVQTHAEEIKEMVLALRSRDVTRPPATATPPPPVPPGGATAAEIRERLGEPERPPAPEPEREPITVERAAEPALHSEATTVSDGRERSLRELFWGED